MCGAVIRHCFNNWLLSLFSCVVLCAVAFHYGHEATAELDWPHYHDAWRDIAIAQSILDGRYPEDPILLGETLWYNPLVGAMVAAVSRITGLPPYLVDTRLGAYVNVLIPISFFILLACLFDPWVALAALVFFLAGNSRDQNYGAWFVTLTYSPLLWSPTFAQALFFMTLLLYWKARRANRYVWYAATGVLWGVTFIAHTAPAILLGCTFALMIFIRPGRSIKTQTPDDIAAPGETQGGVPGTRRLAQFLLASAVAFLISLPYTYSILIHYQFRMRNIRPTLYVDPALALSNLPHFLTECASISTAIAVLGLVFMLFRERKRVATWLVACWLFSVLAFLVQLYLSQAMKQAWGVELRQLVPGHHFLISLAALKALLFGFGLVTLSRAAETRMRAIWKKAPVKEGQDEGLREIPLSPFSPSRNAFGITPLAAIIVTCAVLYPSYPTRQQFKRAYDGGWQHTCFFEDRKKAYLWILDHTSPADVFLCDELLANRIVMPAARKVVVTIDVFFNPYVEFNSRRDDKLAMFKALDARDGPTFRALASKYHVTYLLMTDQAIVEKNNWLNVPSYERIQSLALPFLDLVYHEDGLAIYRLVPAGESG